jgi:hypothetical protein
VFKSIRLGLKPNLFTKSAVSDPKHWAFPDGEPNVLLVGVLASRTTDGDRIDAASVFTEE